MFGFHVNCERQEEDTWFHESYRLSMSPSRVQLLTSLSAHAPHAPRHVLKCRRHLSPHTQLMLPVTCSAADDTSLLTHSSCSPSRVHLPTTPLSSHTAHAPRHVFKCRRHLSPHTQLMLPVTSSSADDTSLLTHSSCSPSRVQLPTTNFSSNTVHALRHVFKCRRHLSPHT